MSKNDTKDSRPSWVDQHVALYRSEPEKGHLWDSTAVGGPGLLPTLLLSTRGRKTGKTSVQPLIYGKHGNSFVIIASKGGAPKHPAWYLNLQAAPECKIQVASEHYQVTARDAQGEERASLWQQLAVIYPPYNDYQKATSRQIPVVVLDPTD